jgi:isoquinoline 1-oxidoreductase
MNDHVPSLPFTPERYEQHAATSYTFESTRRGFLRGLGGGLLVALAWSIARDARAGSSPSRVEKLGSAWLPTVDETQLESWIHIDADSAVTIYCGKIEMGQGVRTSLTQALLDELSVPLESVRFVLGDVTTCPYDAGTFGSMSTPNLSPQIRRVGATARKVLLDLAAEKWGVSASNLELKNGQVEDGNGQSIAIGELVDGQELSAQVGNSVEIRPVSEWTVSGTSLPKVGGREIVTGEHRFCSDFWIDNLHYGQVVRPATLDGEVGDVDTSDAEAIDGVVVVRDGSFVGVVAPEPYLLERAIAAIKVNYRGGGALSRSNWQSRIREHAYTPEAWRGKTEMRLGVPSRQSAAQSVRASYSAPHIAHCALEPEAAVALWEGSKLSVWAATQTPFAVAKTLRSEFSLSEADVHLQVPDFGSGYGGKMIADASIAAAKLAKGSGLPVKVVWTREEQFTWTYFRPAAVVDARLDLAEDGSILNLEQVNINGGLSGLMAPYRAEHEHVQFLASRADLRQGSYRAVGATVNHFARESAVDEAGRAMGQDALEYRRAQLKEPRLIAALDEAAKRFKWGENKPEKHGHGLSACEDKAGYLATCVEVRVDDDGTLTLVRIVTVCDIGAVLNPGNAQSQIEGSVIMALGGALWEELVYENGTIKNAAFSKYRVPRFTDIPEMETVIVDNKADRSAGAGECGMVGIAPAIANAIADATGKRIRQLPLAPDGKIRS